MYAEAISMKVRCIRQKTQTSCYHVKFVAVIALSLLQQKQGIRKEENNMKHITITEFIKEQKPEVTKCNICGSLISAKEAMMPCGPYHSDRTGKYVCPHCYGNYVIPLIDGLAEMERTADREELMNEREYRC